MLSPRRRDDNFHIGELKQHVFQIIHPAKVIRISARVGVQYPVKIEKYQHYASE